MRSLITWCRKVHEAVDVVKPKAVMLTLALGLAFMLVMKHLGSGCRTSK